MKSKCQRCSNEVNDEEMETLHKCKICEKILFNRDFLNPLEKQIINNYKIVIQTDYGNFLTGLFEFGSYLENKTECGDIDFLITFDEKNLNRVIDFEITSLHSYYDLIDYFDDEKLKPITTLINGHWDYRTCDEYPECLECFANIRCKLPDSDYTASIHIYCENECKYRNKTTYPKCCYTDCLFLKDQINNRIFKDIQKILTKDGIDYFFISKDMTIKIIDIVVKKSIDELITEFASMRTKKELKFIKII